MRLPGSFLATLFCLVAASGLPTAPASGQVGQSDMLNANLASEEELAALPQLTPELAERIVASRPYTRVTELHAVVGHLGPEELDGLYRRLWLPINLNDAPRDEILLIPGVGSRMAHEFEEYRPYVALAQFRREIGKYVDDDEVARLEGYVFVPIDLNRASREDILTIPGVGNRMAHEFEEYRPYRAISQFRREIGKYVDDDEVARLERYVRLEP